MSKFRTLKLNNIVTADEHIENLKSKTIYHSAKTANIKKNGVTYNNAIHKDTNTGCLISTDSYNTFFNLVQGNNLCNPPDISYSLQGQMNESNLIAVNTDSLNIIYPSPIADGSVNTITFPLTYDCSCGDVYQNPGILIDPSNHLVNKVTCEPYIRTMDTSNNTLIYDLSNTGILDGSESYYNRINLSNNQYQKFYLSSKINLN